MKRVSFFLIFISSFTLISCQTTKFEPDAINDISESREFDDLVKVRPAVGDKKNTVVRRKEAFVELEKSDKKKKISSRPVVKKKKQKKKKGKKTELRKRLPSLEDTEGFVGRRPVKDPFRVGEKVRLRLTYFGVSAGYLTLSVNPFVEVNGHKSYEFVTRIKSSDTFSLFYSIDDVAKAHVDYKTLLPYDFSLNVKESKQLVKARSYHDILTNQAVYWEKKVTKSKGLQETRKEWEIEPYSQNVFSAIFYMRVFTYRPGKEMAFRVADKGENIVFRGKVLRKEVLDTKLGKMDTIVVQPQITIKGVFKPVGDIFLWLTNDDRKLPVKVQSKIQIGSIIGYLDELHP